MVAKPGVIGMRQHKSDKPAQDLTAEQVRQLLAAMSGGAVSQTQAGILLHAIGVFARRGVARTTVEDLLRAAGVSRRTFYKYYRSKQDVLETIYRLMVANMVQRFHEQIGQGGDLADTLRSLVHVYVSYHASMGPIMRLLLEEARLSDSLLAPHRQRAYQQVVRLLQATIRQETGREVEELALMSLLWSLENATLHLAAEAFDATTCARMERVLQGLVCAVALGQADKELLLNPADV